MSARGATAPRGGVSARRAVPLPGRRMARRMGALLTACVILAAGYVFWLRDSSLVQVQEVTVTGLRGANSERVRAALTSTAKDMTTLHVDAAELERATEAYPVVRAIEVAPDFPSGMRIHVVQHRPAALLESGSRRVPVAGDGTVLAGLPVKGNLPLVKITGALPGKRILPGGPLEAVRVAAGLPSALKDRVGEVVRERGKGVVVPLEDGPRLIFGDGTRAAAKWAAAVRVLADPDAAGAAYVDVRIPERPAAGGLPVETVAPVAPAQSPATQQPLAPSTPEPAATATAPAAPATGPGAGAQPQPITPGTSPGQERLSTPDGPPAQPGVAEGGGAVPNPRP